MKSFWIWGKERDLVNLKILLWTRTYGTFYIRAGHKADLTREENIFGPPSFEKSK
jgi:hypothetical protein